MFLNFDDENEGYWPAYVDAVTNLAISLLFLVAVMSVIVIGLNLKIGQGIKDKAVSVDVAKTTNKNDAINPDALSSTQEKINNNKPQEKQDAESNNIDELVDKQEKNESIKDNIKTKDKSDKEMKVAPKNRPSHVEKQEKKPLKKNNKIIDEHEKTIYAEAIKLNNKDSNSTVYIISKGIVVSFSQDVVEVSESESKEIIDKLKAISTLQGTDWEINVISPKGFSEAIRMAFYRSNAVRNVLMQNGVSATAINLKIIESEDPAADNTQVAIIKK